MFAHYWNQSFKVNFSLFKENFIIGSQFNAWSVQKSSRHSSEIPFRADIRPWTKQDHHLMLFSQLEKQWEIFITSLKVEVSSAQLVVVPNNVYTQCIETQSLYHENPVLPVLHRNSLVMDLACSDRQQSGSVNAFFRLHIKILQEDRIITYKYVIIIKVIKIGMLPQNWLNTRLVNPIHKGIDHNNHISNSADKIKIKKSLNEIDMPLKRRSVFQLKAKSMERYERSASEQDGEKGYVQKRSKNSGYVSHLFSVLRRNQSQKQGNQKQKLTVSNLKQELNNLGSNVNQMAPGKIRSNGKSKKRISLSLPKQQSDNSRRQSHPQVTSKNLKDYTKYIESKTSYCTQVNYNNLRGLQKFEAFAEIDIKEYKIVESITLCIIDGLSGDQPCSENLIQQYCSLFFHNQERRKFEIVLNYHVFKSFSMKIKTVFAYARLWFYFVAKLAEHKLIFLKEVTKIALDGIRLVDRLLKSLYQAVSQALSRSTSSVLQAFKSLKTVKQIQKIIKQFETLTVEVQTILNKEKQSPLTKNSKFVTQFTQIYTNLKPFLNESSFYHLEQYLSRVQIVLSWKYLRIPPVPYLPEKNSNLANTINGNKYTLVMGLSKVIILYNHETRVLKYRPYMDTFLSRIKDSFQIIVFSDFDKQLTDRIVKQIEKNQEFFSARLYHDHMSFKNGKIAKDITKLGRSMAQTIFLDVKENFTNHPQNQLPIAEFKPTGINQSSLVRQKTLLNIMNQLLVIQKSYPADVRKILKRTSQLCHISEVSSIQEHSISISSNGPNKKQQAIL